jgi:hypothetical protein
MADSPKYRELVETEEYSAQLEDFARRYSDAILEPLLMGVLWGIANHPEQYEKVTPNIRQARSRSLNEGEPCFKILFSIENQDKVVLMWIEEIIGIDEIEPEGTVQ